MKSIYLEHELLQLWQASEQVRHNPKWAHKVFAAWLLLSTGLRIQEACDLRLEDCLEKCVIVRHGKGDKAREAEILPEWRPYYLHYLRCVRGTRGIWLFPGERRIIRGKFRHPAIAQRSYRYWWEDVIRHAGIRYLPPHRARATFISWFSDRLTMQEMKDQIGHATIGTTETYYRVSIPGRRFEKSVPSWIQAMVEGSLIVLREVKSA